MNKNTMVNGNSKPYGLQGTLSNEFVNNNTLLQMAKKEGIGGTALFKAFAELMSLQNKQVMSLNNIIEYAKKIQKEARAFGKTATFDDKKKEKKALEHINFFLSLSKVEQSAWRSLLKQKGNYGQVNMTKKK